MTMSILLHASSGQCSGVCVGLTLTGFLDSLDH